MGGHVFTEPKEVMVDMEGIVRNYTSGNNQVKALRRVDLTIKKEEFVGIIGPSASGKTTLLNLIGCLDTPSEGRYILKGKNTQDLSRIEKAKIRNQMFGFVFQTFNLLPELDVYANIALPLKYSNKPKRLWSSMVEEALELVDMKGLGHRYPDQLSGGQQQRVAIARALVNKPDIILADEPTGSLDTMTGQGIMEELRMLNKHMHRTVIVITHDLRIAGYADRIIRIEDGEIKEDTKVGKEALAWENIKSPFIDLEREECNEDIL